jgi:hypothetical protein
MHFPENCNKNLGYRDRRKPFPYIDSLHGRRNASRDVWVNGSVCAAKQPRGLLKKLECSVLAEP